MTMPNGYERPIVDSIEYGEEGELLCNMEGSNCSNTVRPPPRSWCLHCANAMSRDDPHRRVKKEAPDIDISLGKTPTVSIDLVYLYEIGVKPTLVAIDHESSRIWSYALKDKTILGGSGWKEFGSGRR